MAGKVVIGIRERRHHHRDLQAHLDGRARPKTALGAETCRDRRGREPVVMLAGDPDAAQAALDAHRERLKTTPGRRPNEVIELMLAGPPPFEIERDKHGREVGVEPWPADRVDEWAECALAWLRVVIGPDAVLEGFWFHADEKSPHVHASVIPACDGRLSWKACLERFAQSYLGTGNVHHRRLYAALRDSYHESVGGALRPRARGGGTRARAGGIARSQPPSIVPTPPGTKSVRRGPNETNSSASARSSRATAGSPPPTTTSFSLSSRPTWRRQPRGKRTERATRGARSKRRAASETRCARQRTGLSKRRSRPGTQRSVNRRRPARRAPRPTRWNGSATRREWR